MRFRSDGDIFSVNVTDRCSTDVLFISFINTLLGPFHLSGTLTKQTKPPNIKQEKMYVLKYTV